MHLLVRLIAALLRFAAIPYNRQCGGLRVPEI